MKANRAFRASDEAVSPVVAAVLLVAIGIVLSATVFVWVSGFGAKAHKPAQAVSLISDHALRNGYANYTVSAASPSLYYRDLTLTLDGDALAVSGTCAAPTPGRLTLCRGITALDRDDLVRAGDRLMLGASAGQTLRVLDTDANGLLFTALVG